MFTTDNIIFYLPLAVVVVLLVWLIRLEWRLHRLLRGSRGGLEAAINSLHTRVGDTDQVNEQIKNHLRQMEERLRRSIQQVKTVRFNPFRGEGGNQSFATAFLDEDGNGTVISGLYSREKVNVYAKPIVKYQSEHELTDEEKTAIGR